MSKTFKLQDPGEGITEVEIIDVLVSAGDEVDEGQAVFEVETDKATIEINADFSGTISGIPVSKGDVAEVGDTLLEYDGAGGSDPKSDQGDQAGTKKKKSRQKDDKQSQERKEESDEADEQKKSRKEKPRKESEQLSEEPTEEQQSTSHKTDREQNDDEPVPAAPATRKLARDLDVELRSIDGSGPEGRVTEDDVRQAAKQSSGETPSSEESAASGSQEAEGFAQHGPVEREALSGIRRATAKQMSKSWNEIPHVMHQEMADITDLEAFRADLSDENVTKPTLTAFLIKALASALQQHPRFNASLSENGEELILKQYYHIGVAVDTDDGLLVPVLRDVDSKSLATIHDELRSIAAKARRREITAEDMQGGCCTVTNPGGIGGVSFTPIINHPEVAILGVGRLIRQLEPTDDSGSRTQVRLRLPLCLAFDHRVNDGADAARFMNTICELLMSPQAFMVSV